MTRSRLLVSVVAIAVVSGCAGTQAVSSNEAEVSDAEARRFLTPEETPDLAAILPTYKELVAADEADRAYFERTRKLAGGERWSLALNDDNYSQVAIMADYSCAIGVKLTPENVPLTSRLVAMASTDAAMASDVAKEHYERPRPFLANEGPICLERSARLEASFDYPSGHSSAGWMAGLVLAELAPDRATQIMTRSRAYAESRAVCGVHNRSSTVAGHTVGSVVYARLQGEADYRAAADKARAELEKARETGEKPDAVACEAEARLIAPQ